MTVNAGSNDLTLISDFNGPDPVTTTIASGGVDPDAAFAFSSSSGFDDLVVGNGGDGVLALFEGGADGLTLTSAETEPDLPSPTALAFSALTGGQVQFYAATAGREAAALVALSLGGGEISPAAPAVPAHARRRPTGPAPGVVAGPGRHALDRHASVCRRAEPGSRGDRGRGCNRAVRSFRGVGWLWPEGIRSRSR